MIAVSLWDPHEHAAFSREALISAAGIEGAAPAAEHRLEEAGYSLDSPQVFEMTANAPCKHILRFTMSCRSQSQERRRFGSGATVGRRMSVRSPQSA
jgi:hypothetical protein